MRIRGRAAVVVVVVVVVGEPQRVGDGPGQRLKLTRWPETIWRPNGRSNALRTAHP